jgi:hypothetical protein
LQFQELYAIIHLVRKLRISHQKEGISHETGNVFDLGAYPVPEPLRLRQSGKI